MRTGGPGREREGGDRAEGADWRQGAAVWAVVRRGAAAGGCGVEPAVVRVRADGVWKFGTAKNRGQVGELRSCCARPRWWAGLVNLRPERWVSLFNCRWVLFFYCTAAGY